MVNIKEAIVKAMEYFDLIYDDKNTLICNLRKLSCLRIVVTG